MTPPTLHRRIGLWLLIFYGVGVMVGAGIYVLVGKVAGGAGALTPLAFLIAGAAAGLTALSFAELSARIPESAGEAAFTREAFGSRRFGDAVGVAVATVGVVSAAAILKGGVGYVLAFVDLPRFWLELGFGLALGVVAAVGIVESLTVAAVFTVVEIVGLVLVAGAGMAAEPATTFAEMTDLSQLSGDGIGLVFAAALLAFFAFVGFEDMVNLAEEVVDPVRNMPKAIVIAVSVTTLLYCLVSVAALHAVAPADLDKSERPLALVFETGSGRSAELILAIAIVATMNGVLAQIVMSARVLYGLGRRSPVFAWAYEAHPRLGTPLKATALATVIVLGLASVAPIETLAEATSMILLIVFVVVNVALLALKRRGPPPAGCPNTPWITPVLAIAICIALALS